MKSINKQEPSSAIEVTNIKCDLPEVENSQH